MADAFIEGVLSGWTSVCFVAAETYTRRRRRAVGPGSAASSGCVYRFRWTCGRERTVGMCVRNAPGTAASWMDVL